MRTWLLLACVALSVSCGDDDMAGDASVDSAPDTSVDTSLVDTALDTSGDTSLVDSAPDTSGVSCTPSGLFCDAGEVCVRGGRCEGPGACVSPSDCVDEGSVCGCDGQNYESECAARAAGVDTSFDTSICE